MRGGRRTNLALLALVATALATGTASFAVGAPPTTSLVTTAHAASGLALLLLVPWKQAVARRGLARPAHPGRRAGWLLAVLLLISISTGVVQEVVGFTTVLGITALQLHVATALLAIPLLTMHLVTHPQRPRATDLSRRTLLAAGLLGAGALAAVGLTRRLGPESLAQQGTGSTERGSFVPSRMPVTQWFTDVVPPRARRDAPLLVNGVPVDIGGLDDEVEAVLDCTGGWFATQRWRGIHLDHLLGALPAGARSIDVISTTGYRRRFPVEQAKDLLLATSVGGQPLSPGHGAPRRLVAPGRRGFWWVKWVVAIEVVDDPPWRQPPFPLQ